MCMCVCVCLYVCVGVLFVAARRWGRASLFLEVDSHNAAARQLYSKRGFVAVRRMGWPWRTRPKVIMCKDLPRTRTRTKPILSSDRSTQKTAQPAKGFETSTRAGSASANKSGVFDWSDVSGE